MTDIKQPAPGTVKPPVPQPRAAPTAPRAAQPQAGAEQQARTAGVPANPDATPEDAAIEDLARRICAAHGVPDGNRLVSSTAPQQLDSPAGYVYHTPTNAQRPMWESYKDIARVAIKVQNEKKTEKV